MKKYIKCLVIGISGLVLLSGCTKEIMPEAVGNEAISVQKAVTEAKGVVDVEESTSFYLDFPATVGEVSVKSGDKVQKGDVLLVLDLEEYENLLNQKINEKALYMLELSGLQKIDYPQNPHIAQLTSSLSLKELQLSQGTDADMVMLSTTLSLAKESKEELLKDYEVSKELLAIGGISQKQVTELEQSIRAKNKEIDDLEIKLKETKDLKQEEIDSLKAQIKDLETQVSNTSTQTSTQKSKLSLQIETTNLQIKAMEKKINKPYIEGNKVIATEDNMLIYDLAVEKGTKTDTLMGPAFKGLDTTKRVVIADVPEEYSDELKVGSKVNIIPYVNEEKTLQGTVIRISEQVVENYGETVVKTTVQVEDTDSILRIGSSVDMEF